DVRQVGYDVLTYAVAEILLLWFAAHVCEGEHTDGCALFRLFFRRRAGISFGRNRSARATNRIKQIAERFGLAMTIPRAKVDGMKLAKSERRLGRADRDWDKTLSIASFGCFVLDPRGA